MIAALRVCVCASVRKRSQYAMNDSHNDDDGVIGYHAATVHPPITQPRAAELLPSIKIRPSVLPLMRSKRYGSLFVKFSAAYSMPMRIASMLVSTALGFRLNCVRRAASSASIG